MHNGIGHMVAPPPRERSGTVPSFPPLDIRPGSPGHQTWGTSLLENSGGDLFKLVYLETPLEATSGGGH